MCDIFGSKKAAKKSEATARAAEAETKAKEEKRQADIKLGNQNIDTAFSQYNPGYYSAYADKYKANYNPQIDTQYGEAVDKLTASLAGRGMLDSSVGASNLAKTFQVKNDAKARVGNDAEVAAGDLKGKVAARKADLYSLNQSAADPEGAQANAVGAATSLTAPPAYSDLGRVFASVMDPIAAFAKAKQNSPGAAYSYKPTSSYKVVN